jgi:hypothetical protein
MPNPLLHIVFMHPLLLGRKIRQVDLAHVRTPPRACSPELRPAPKIEQSPFRSKGMCVQAQKCIR